MDGEVLEAAADDGLVRLFPPEKGVELPCRHSITKMDANKKLSIFKILKISISVWVYDGFHRFPKFRHR